MSRGNFHVITSMYILVCNKPDAISAHAGFFFLKMMMHGVMRHHHNKRIRGFFNTYTEKVFLQFQELEIRILGTIIKFKRRARASARRESFKEKRR